MYLFLVPFTPSPIHPNKFQCKEPFIRSHLISKQRPALLRWTFGWYSLTYDPDKCDKSSLSVPNGSTLNCDSWLVSLEDWSLMKQNKTFPCCQVNPFLRGLSGVWRNCAQQSQSSILSSFLFPGCSHAAVGMIFSSSTSIRCTSTNVFALFNLAQTAHSNMCHKCSMGLGSKELADHPTLSPPWIWW